MGLAAAAQVYDEISEVKNPEKMKKLLLFVAMAVLFSNCSLPAYETLYYTDFTRYANENFFVSSTTDYTGKPYVALGNIAIEYYPGSGLTKQKTPDIQSMLDRLVNAAKKVGANGIIGYSCHLTVASKYDPVKWIASGIAVHFDNSPNKPSFLQPDKKTENEIAQITTKDTTDFAEQTVNYLITNNIKFIIWSAAYGDLYFDLEQEKHITLEEFETKYGNSLAYTIDIMYQKARKAQRKSARRAE